MKAKHVLEYIVLRAVGSLAIMLPYRAALFMGWLVALVFFHICRFRVAEAKTRIRQVFGDSLSDREVSDIAWRSFRNMVFSGIEMLRFPRMTLEWAKSVSSHEEFISVLQNHLKSGKGAVLGCGHLGSWEMAAVMSRLSGIPIFSIVAEQRNQLVNRYIANLRNSQGIDAIPRGMGGMREVLRRLKRGQVVAILPDVRVPSGMRVSFLGGEANIGEGMGLFARHADVPVFPLTVRRLGWARHEVDVHEPVWPDSSVDKTEDARRITVALLRIVEAAIRRDPGQWFWFNKRWVLDPVE